jgi:hypothetical protein
MAVMQLLRVQPSGSIRPWCLSLKQLGKDLQWTQLQTLTFSIGTWGGLSTPEQLCRAIEYTEEEEDSNEPRYVLLYMANGALGTTHPLGLVLNQSEATAMQHMSIRDTEITMNGRQLWLPLEVILDGLVDMIEQGKILAVDATYSGEQERTEPWIMPSYTDRDLEESLQAFQQLVDVIHDRMPSKPQIVEKGLLEMVTAGNPNILLANSFAH